MKAKFQNLLCHRWRFNALPKVIRAFSSIAFLAGLSAFAYLASLPSDTQSDVLNLSPFRIISLAVILAVICVSVFVFVKYSSIQKITELSSWIEGFGAGIFLSFGLFAGALTAWVIFLYRESTVSLVGEAAYQRLTPLLLLASLVGLELALVLLIPYFKEKRETLLRNVWTVWLFLMGGFFILAAFTALTGIGFTFDNVGLNWGPAGTPLSFAQVNLVMSIGFLLSFLMYIIGSRIKNGHSRLLLVLDVGVFVALWGLAVLLWSSQTISPSHFSPAPSAPNYEYYPYSDAAIFDRMSYHLLSGSGFSNSLVRRPLYVGLVAVFHALGGTGYEETVFIQILFLALLPSFVYLLTTRLSNRLAGFLAGGLIVFREMNAIALSGVIVTSHAKLIMSDLTAALGIVVFVYACILLFKNTRHDKWLLLVIGASLGLLALVRAQSLVLAPLILLLVLIPQKSGKPLFTSSMIILAGLVIVIAPWAWRNWNNTGVLALGDPGEKMLMARNYSLDPIEYPQPMAGESTAEFSSRLSREIFSFAIEHPGSVAFFISNHFMHSLAESAVFIAPVYSTDTPQSLVSQNPFWDIWEGSLDGKDLFALLCNLSILAFGISLAQKDDKIAGWYPLLVFVIYQAGNALARTSGWRFALPVDWITLMYFCVALSYLPARIGLLFADQFPAAEKKRELLGSGTVYPIVFFLLFFVGVSLPLAELLIPGQDFEISEAQNVLTEKNILTTEQLSQFLEQKNAVFVSGIALYPRYYKPNGDIYLADMPENFRYLHFWLINEGDAQIVLPREKPPEFFSHASSVSVIGCSSGDFISARVVVLKTEEGAQVIFQEPTFSLVCP